MTDPELAERPSVTEVARMAAGIVQHRGPMTKPELSAALDVLIDSYQESLLSSAMWRAWRERRIRLSVDDEGDVVMFPATDSPDEDF